jgi:uncharacterized protein (TIGR03437 family)
VPRHAFVTCLLAGLLLSNARAQLIPSGTAVPPTTLPPVVFIDGYQATCPATFSGTFGIADQVLQSNGEVSMFFSTCSLPPTASIEDLAAAFATFLSGLNYTNGQPVEQVDVVAHSMGGLVLRCYLSGKQNAAGMFQPPASTHVRKAVLLAAPNFGTPIASILGITDQVDEMASGSSFLFGLDTWIQGTDDLRGVDAVAAAGNAGSGGTGDPAGFDDGVVPLTSASLRFYLPGRTRVIPYCHIDGGGIISLLNLCPENAPGIADIESATHDSARIIVSFLGGTSDWQSVGTAAENNSFLSVDGGLIAEARAADDSSLNIGSASAVLPGTALSKQLSISSDGLAYADQFTAGAVPLNVTSGSLNINTTVTLPAGGTEPYTVKAGPLIARVFPAAAANFPLVLAPRMFVAIYGADLADKTAEATGATFPSQLADAQVLADGTAIPLYYVSAAQIDAVLPDGASGLTQLTVQNSAGQHTVNVYVEAAAPAIFTQDTSGSGPAAALNAANQNLVTADNPLIAGDAVELYATGLGLTKPSNGLDVAVQQPTVTIAGVNCPVTFAGAAPGYIGLDQINCTIPAGIAATASAPVVVTSGTQTSNTTTLAIQ